MNSIHNIYFPQNDICNIEDMYIRLDGNISLEYDNEERIYCLQRKAKISTNTYFNYFSSSKWLKFTNISMFVLEIELKGKFLLKLIYSYMVDDVVQHEIVKIIKISNINKEKITVEHDFELDPFEGMYYFELEALEDNSIFYSATYGTKKEILNNVHIGIVMCTFKREKFIKRNLNLIKKLPIDILSKVDLFIIDNAKTLNKDINKNYNIHLIENKNTGGAGGFTRGIIEIIKKYHNISHILLMDDDILLNTISIERTIQYLKYVNKENKDLFIGGATLRLDKKNIQLEYGAVWNNNILYNLKSGIDLKNEHNLLVNNLEESFSYNSWVFLCMPVIKISLDNLPLPVFVRGDDMEYGIRMIDKLLTINGIGAWHVPVHNKYSAFMTYYVLRNILLLNALYDSKFGSIEAIKLLIKRIARETMYFRYDNVKLILKAYNDFLCGIKFFESTDGEKLHKEISSYCNKLFNYKDLEKLGYPFVYDIYNKSIIHINENKLAKLMRLITLNGYLLPKVLYRKKYNIVEFTAAKPIDFYRYKNVLQIDLTTQKGCVTYIDKIVFIKITYKLFIMIMKILFTYNYAVKDYKNNITKLRDIKFWENYLNIDD